MNNLPYISLINSFVPSNLKPLYLLKYSIYRYTSFTSYASISMLFHMSWFVLTCLTKNFCMTVNDDVIIHMIPRSFWKRYQAEFICLCYLKFRALKRTGFLETLRYDATTTTVVLSSIAHTLITPRGLISSPISSLIM